LWPFIAAVSRADDPGMQPLQTAEAAIHPGQIGVLRVGKHWVVRVGGHDYETEGDQKDATARAFSIAQLGGGSQDVVIFGTDGSVAERRTFRPRI
jgi:Uncharacterized protein conserved in bacteria (DUF2188)